MKNGEIYYNGHLWVIDRRFQRPDGEGYLYIAKVIATKKREYQGFETGVIAAGIIDKKVIKKEDLILYTHLPYKSRRFFELLAGK